MAVGDDHDSVGQEAALLEVEALTDDSAYDKLMARGGTSTIPAALVRQQTGWDGLTPKEEEAARKHREDEERAELDRAAARCTGSF